MTRDHSRSSPSRTLDPVLALQVDKDQAGLSVLGGGGSLASVSSLCFVDSPNHAATPPLRTNDDSSDDDGESIDNDSTDTPEFRCRGLVQGERCHDQDATARAREAAASVSLAGYKLLSCHTNGDSYIWDLSQRRIVEDFAPNRGPGLALCRFRSTIDDSSSAVLYHTRDSNGTISLHDLNGTTNRTIAQYETHSKTFCPATPCTGNANLLATPWHHDSVAAIRDVRIPSQSPPVALVLGAGIPDPSTIDTNPRGHGMLTSLAFSETGGGRPILACGMESGSLFFHDLAMLRNNDTSFRRAPIFCQQASCSVKLSKDPVLALDMTPSVLPGSSGADGSVVAIAGMAGDAAELSELAAIDQGTVAVVKATLRDESLEARLRARFATCQIGDGEGRGKPGVSICRFRPDGRMFAVGGWDKRLRIFDRSKAASPLAILKGHEASVTSADWAPDAISSGLLATGAGDGCIYIWRCFSS
jgi:WD40 repeat protein